MSDKLSAVSIITTIHKTFEQCLREASHTRPHKLRKLLWQRHSFPSNMVRIEKNFTFEARHYVEALVIENSLDITMRVRIKSLVEDKLAEMVALIKGSAIIPAGKIAVCVECRSNEIETIYGVQVFRRITGPCD